MIDQIVRSEANKLAKEAVFVDKEGGDSDLVRSNLHDEKLCEPPPSDTSTSP